MYGYAVAFTRVLTQEVNLPLDIERDIILDASNLENIDAFIRGAFAFWHRFVRRQVPTLTTRQFKRFRKDILHPSLDLVPKLGGRLTADGKMLIRLSQEQLW